MIICDYFVYFHCNDTCFSVSRADKIPAAQYSSYVESCQKQRQQDSEYSLNTRLLYTDKDNHHFSFLYVVSAQFSLTPWI